MEVEARESTETNAIHMLEYRVFRREIILQRVHWYFVISVLYMHPSGACCESSLQSSNHSAIKAPHNTSPAAYKLAFFLKALMRPLVLAS